ncbi:MAG: ABC transporter ATP-binding protein, partial [Candidatus Kapaibacteriota bacterium]
VGGALGSVAEVWGQIQKSLGATVRIRELLQIELETEHGDAVAQDRFTTVSFEHVSFAYPERTDVTVLHDLTFSIAAGERVALVGQSGSGKSTTAALIQRLYEPTSGRILYDGCSAEDLALSTVRQSVGVVPQDIVLFGGTIEENIRYGRRDADVQEVRDAARRANALSFIESFPEGMNTLVGERGMKLSGGQRQRIAIARALLKDPPILILDEATSSLDAESEQLIQEALEHLLHRRTSIIIAHRLSTVRTCDRILVMDGGRIVEHGTHNELLVLQGRYARWCDLQFMG